MTAAKAPLQHAERQRQRPVWTTRLGGRNAGCLWLAAAAGSQQQP
jgi:hypothetical protein